MIINITADNEETHTLEGPVIGVSIYPTEKKAEIHLDAQVSWIFHYKSWKYDDGVTPLEGEEPLNDGPDPEPEDTEEREPSWNFCVAEGEKIQRMALLDQVLASMTQGLAQAQVQAQMNVGIPIIGERGKKH